jgi:peptide/nickel transport system permease protein
MLSFLGKRLLLAIPTLFAVSFITFFLGYLAPGSPVEVMAGKISDPARIKQIEHEYGLDRPPLVQYGSWVGNALRGDFGRSFANADRPITTMIAEKFPVTAFIACLSLLVAMLVGLPTGVLAALKHNGLLDRAAMSGVLLLVSVPAFVLAPLLMLFFGLRLDWLPVYGWKGFDIWNVDPSDWWEMAKHWVLPTAVLAARPAALMARFMRSSMLETLRQDYIRTAHAKGLSPARVVTRHALKNAFLPVLTVIGSAFGYLLTGSFVVETIFTIPGVGYESVQSIKSRDYPVIQGVALLVAAIFILVNLVVDLLYTVVDPRVRHEGSR